MTHSMLMEHPNWFENQTSNRPPDRVNSNLSQVGRLIASAAIVFKAELCYLEARGVRLSAVPPKKGRTLQVLTQTGLCELLKIPTATVVDREDTVHWRHTSGVWNLAQPSRLLELLRPEGPNNIDPAEMAANPLYRGMIEVVGNSIEHAYLNHPSRRSFMDRQEGWWAFQQLRDGELTTCICDLGIGIAEALPLKLSDEPDLLRKLQYLVRKTKGRDVRALLAAVEYGRTSTHEQQRGKGLKDAHKVIDDAGRGVFQLISNRGLYVYTLTPEKQQKTGTIRLQGTVSGTIAVWTFPINT